MSGANKRTKLSSGPETKGGGFRGGPKRWTGRGPAPARHIPWPEIFRHHISLIEGHLKMIDMVRKHTVEGTGNWETITQAIDRAKEMLATSKYVARNFVPPPEQRERVPLGSSSASMYPGYSPTDHEYGRAAEEFGCYATQMREKGKVIETDEVDYEIGQAKGIRRKKTLAGIREALGNKKEKEGSGLESGSGSDTPARKYTNGNTASTGDAGGDKNPAATSEAPAGGDNPSFVVDTKPMKVDLSGSQRHKRSATPPDSMDVKKHKKTKKKHEGDLPTGEGFEDISGEVDAKLKEKEEKRKRKKERKRKRESDGPSSVTATDARALTVECEKPKKKRQKHGNEQAAMGKDDGKNGVLEDRDDHKNGEVEKSKKKKQKRVNEEELPDRSVPAKSASEEGDGEGGGEVKRGKKQKKADGE